jgi:hypothetical protein
LREPCVRVEAVARDFVAAGACKSMRTNEGEKRPVVARGANYVG